MHTTRGVQHWWSPRPQVPDGQRIVAVAFVSAVSARVLAAGGLSSNADAAPVSMTFTSWATGDGGMHWSPGGSFRAVQDPGLSWQGALDFVNVDDGWFSANQDDTDASLEMTLLPHGRRRGSLGSGGSSRPVVDLIECRVPCFAQPTATFISATTGWLTGGGCATAQFEVTRNGGATWSPQTLPLLARCTWG